MHCRWLAIGYLSGTRGICTIFSHNYQACQALSAMLDIFWANAGKAPRETIDPLAELVRKSGV
jgi:hypothetical protein